MIGRYTWPRLGVDNLGAAVCTDCGALVADTTTHDTWHSDTNVRLDLLRRMIDQRTTS